MKILSLDVGNTTIDACIFEKGHCTHLGRFTHKEINSLPKDCDKVAVVSVKSSIEAKLRKLFGDKLRVLSLKDIPIDIDYKTTQTLGVDRVLFAYAVKKMHTQDAILLMVGTALVIDLLIDGTFMGGFITASPKLKLKALSQNTEGIPPLEVADRRISIGKSTQECVVGGVFQESFSFVENTASRWSKEYKKDLPIIITGGDGELFKALGTYEPLILHRALYRIIINE